MNIVEVQFDYNKSSSFFKNFKFNLKNNITVIVNTEKGLQFGKVVNIFNDLDQFKGISMYEVAKIASKKDYFHYLDNLKLEEEAVFKCRQIVEKNKLNMTILDGHYNFDRTQLLFRFVADERVDFRQLAKELGLTFHTRIELRQIGIRDKAKEIGGIGPCGRLLCCSSFLKNFDSITINMAKNQNVSLNPSKINGVCGRLLCCLKYENETYLNLKKKFPKVGDKITISKGEGKVVALNLLQNKYTVELDNREQVEVDCDEGKK